MTFSFTVLILALSVSACADDLKTDDDGDGVSSLEIHTDVKGDVRETTVNASDKEKYRYFDLDEDEEVDEGSAAWDVAFQRFEIKTNGGDSGDGDVVVAKLAGADFDELSTAPDTGYVEDSDAVSSKSEGGDPNYAFLGPEPWYKYEGSNHQLSPADVVYVLRSSEEQFFKIAMLDYYDKAGTAGYPRFKWAKIDAPAEPVSAEAPEAEEPEATSGNPEASGCYDTMVHKCDCKGDEAACTEAMGIWTDRCECDTK